MPINTDVNTSPIDKTRHYVIILSSDIFPEIRRRLREMGFKDYIDFYDWYPKSNVCSVDINVDGSVIGKGSYIPFSRFEINEYIESIGRFCSINTNVQIQCNHQMNMIGTGVLQPFFNEADGNTYLELFNKRQNNMGTTKITIGNDVWIGANVFINTSKCSFIGDGAIIGTYSLILDDIPPYAVTYGIPAHIHRYRYTPSEIEILMRVKWWDWDNKTIRANADLLMYPERFFKNFR